MNYELEQKLRNKTDDWKTNNSEQEISHLKSEIQDLKSKNDYYQGKFNNLFRTMEDLINLLLYKEQTPEHENILNQLKQYLY